MKIVILIFISTLSWAVNACDFDRVDSSIYIEYRRLNSIERVFSSVKDKKIWALRSTVDAAVYQLASESCRDNVLSDPFLKSFVSDVVHFVVDNIDKDTGLWTQRGLDNNDPNADRFIAASLLDLIYIFEKKYDDDSFVKIKEKLAPVVERILTGYGEGYAADWASMARFRYPNQDVIVLLIVVLAEKVLDIHKYRVLYHQLVNSLVRNQLSDGGFNYIYREDESPIYHAVVEVYLARIYQLTNDISISHLLTKSLAYWETLSLINGKFEGWRNVYWKNSWSHLPLGALLVAKKISGNMVFGDIYKAYFSQKVFDHYALSVAYAILFESVKWSPRVVLDISRKTQEKQENGDFISLGENYALRLNGRIGLVDSFLGYARLSTPLSVLSKVRVQLNGRNGLLYDVFLSKNKAKFSFESLSDVRVDYFHQPLRDVDVLKNYSNDDFLSGTVVNQNFHLSNGLIRGEISVVDRLKKADSMSIIFDFLGCKDYQLFDRKFIVDGVLISHDIETSTKVAVGTGANNACEFSFRNIPLHKYSYKIELAP